MRDVSGRKNEVIGQIGAILKDRLAMQYSPVGFYYAETKPEDAIGFKGSGNGCIMPLVLASAKCRTVVFDENSLGWNCSAFHLGYRDWIYPGVEYFLSHGILSGKCERFVRWNNLAQRSRENSMK